MAQAVKPLRHGFLGCQLMANRLPADDRWHNPDTPPDELKPPQPLYLETQGCSCVIPNYEECTSARLLVVCCEVLRHTLSGRQIVCRPS